MATTSFLATMFLLILCLLYNVANGYHYVDYVPGNINLIITAPHGGNVTPCYMNDRLSGCWDASTCAFDSSDADCNRQEGECTIVTVNDAYTREIAEMVANTAASSLGQARRPHLVRFNVKRIKVDANREIQVACQGDLGAEAAYNEYHSLIREIQDNSTGRGLLLDMHGQTHDHDRTEIGYVLTRQQIWSIVQSSNGAYGTQSQRSGSSVYRLLEDNNLGIKELITGQNSMGARLEAEGFGAIPSPTVPSETDNYLDYQYFRGGYTTQVYGSRNKFHSDWDALQLEMPKKKRYEEGEAERIRFSEAVGRVVATYFAYYYAL